MKSGLWQFQTLINSLSSHQVQHTPASCTGWDHCAWVSWARRVDLTLRGKQQSSSAGPVPPVLLCDRWIRSQCQSPSAAQQQQWGSHGVTGADWGSAARRGPTLSPNHCPWSCGPARWCIYLPCTSGWIQMRAPVEILANVERWIWPHKHHCTNGKWKTGWCGRGNWKL